MARVARKCLVGTPQWSGPTNRPTPARIPERTPYSVSESVKLLLQSPDYRCLKTKQANNELVPNTSSHRSLTDEICFHADFLKSPLAEIVSNAHFSWSLPDEIVSNTSLHGSLPDEIVSNTVFFSSLPDGIVAEHRLRRSLPDETTCNSLWARSRHVFCFVDDIDGCTTRDMDNPRDDTTKEQYRSRGVFTIAGVRADPETSGMEVAFAASHAALMTKEREIEDLQDAVQEHEAIISVRDAATDKLVRSFDLRLLDLVNKNRDDPRYRRYFPKGLRAVTEADAREAEPELVHGMIKTLDEDQAKPDFAPLHAEFRAKLQAAVEAVEAADKACGQAEEQLGFFQSKVLVELKLKWVEERKKLHAELTKKFPHDPSRVESYFQRFAKPRAKKKSD